ncbi:MAG TPA: RidA family protein [Acetobacteraceae bacterium]|nr:RidA family protein [Acetobacteraceae bacterium]
MAGPIEQRLAELGLALPAAQPPLASYVPYVMTGKLLVISGQLPMADGVLACEGKLGETVALEDGQAAARQCFLNVLAHARTALGGNLDRITRVVRLGGFVACAPTFTQHPAVINGASDLVLQIFGEAGRHARAAVGVASLPLDAAVELEAMFEIS